MSIQLNHTIVWCRDKQKSAAFFTEIFGLPNAKPFGPMLVVPLDINVSIDFYDNDGDISSQHYAFRYLRSFSSVAERRKIRDVNFRAEIEQEEDGRWITEVVDLPGVRTYGSTSAEAQAEVQALALWVVADRLEHGEAGPDLVSISFAAG